MPVEGVGLLYAGNLWRWFPSSPGSPDASASPDPCRRAVPHTFQQCPVHRLYWRLHYLVVRKIVLRMLGDPQAGLDDGLRTGTPVSSAARCGVRRSKGRGTDFAWGKFGS